MIFDLLPFLPDEESAMLLDYMTQKVAKLKEDIVKKSFADVPEEEQNERLDKVLVFMHLLI